MLRLDPPPPASPDESKNGPPVVGRCHSGGAGTSPGHGHRELSLVLAEDQALRAARLGWALAVMLCRRLEIRGYRSF